MNPQTLRGLRRAARWLLVPAAVAGGALLAAGSPASAATTATFSNGILTVFGDSDANTISISRNAAGTIRVNNGAVAVTGGTPTVANTTLVQVFGQAGDDVLRLVETNGALPRANLFGGADNDRLVGGSGNDLLFGQAGDDIVQGQGGSDQLFGGSDDDRLVGGDADDLAFGESGDDTLVWNPGDDTDLNEGGAGADTVRVNGGGGAEVFTTTANGTRVRFDRLDPAPFSIDIGTSENLLLLANGGEDSFSATGNLAALIAIDVRGGDGDDTLLGSNGIDILRGGAGDDTIDGQQGNDTALLGEGDDEFRWDPGDGSDIVEGQQGTDTMLFNGSAGSEVFEATANGSRLRFTRNLGNIVMDVNNVEVVDLNALGGTDTITVDDLSATHVTEFTGDLAGVLDGTAGDAAADVVIVNGTNSDDTVDITGSGTSVTVGGLAAGVNIVNAEGANDSLVVNSLGGDDEVNATTLPAGIIKLTIDGGAGEDNLRGSQGADVFLGGSGDDFVFGDNGNDLAQMGGDEDTFRWDPGDGSDTVEGQEGDDTMLFLGANVDENIDIAANGGRVRFFRNVANVTMDLEDVESIDFRALGGADNIVVGDLGGTDVTSLDADLRASTEGGSDGAVDSVTVNGTQGDDVFGATPVNAGVQVFGLPTDVSVIEPEANDRLTLNALGGNDTVDASSLAAGIIQLAQNGGLGDDVMIGGGGADQFNGGDGNDLALMGAGDDRFVWNPGDDNDTLEGQAGVDTMAFNGANVAENISIARNGGRVTFFRNVASVTMDLNDVEDIDFAALGGADTIAVGDLSGTDVTHVDLGLAAAGGGGDAQPDNVLVDATNGDDVVLVNGGAGSASVLGLSARVDVTGAEAANDRLTVNALAGDDVVEASALQAAAIQLTADGGTGDDVLIGGAGDDVLLGGAGDDVLLGGGGLDVLDGGDGDDIVIQGLTLTATARSADDRVISARPADAEWISTHVQIVDGRTVITLGNKQYRLAGIDLSGLVTEAAALVAAGPTETSEPTEDSAPTESSDPTETSEPMTSDPSDPTAVPGVSIGDLVWFDANGNGLQDAGEPGLEGVVVRLLDAKGSIVGEGVTDRQGHYELAAATAGPLTLEVVVPDGYQPTLGNAGGDDTVDSDADPRDVVAGAAETAVRVAVADPASAGSDLDIGLAAVPAAPPATEAPAAPTTTAAPPAPETTTTAPPATTAAPTTTAAASTTAASTTTTTTTTTTPS